MRLTYYRHYYVDSNFIESYISFYSLKLKLSDLDLFIRPLNQCLIIRLQGFSRIKGLKSRYSATFVSPLAHISLNPFAYLAISCAVLLFYPTITPAYLASQMRKL